jgi:hypothetical protein
LFTGLQVYGARYQALFLPAAWGSPPADHRVERLAEVPALVERILDGSAPA